MTLEELKAKAEALEAKLAEAEEARKKAEERNENAQKVIEQHRSKIGDDTKLKADSTDQTLKLSGELIESGKALRASNDLLAQVQGELAELKKQGPKPQEQPTRPDKEQIAEIEKSLTDDDRKALDGAIAQADDTVKAAILAEAPTPEQDALYLELLKALRRNRQPPSVPRWQRHTPAQKSGAKGDDSRNLDKLFESKKKSEVWTPPGPDGGTPRSFPRGNPPPKPKVDWISNSR